MLLILVGVSRFLVLSMVFSAISTYARAMIYRYATGRPVPGVDPQLFAGVFRPSGPAAASPDAAGTPHPSG